MKKALQFLFFPLLRFFRHQTATVAVEFALLLPIFIILLFGTIEVVRYTQYNHKMDSATSQFINILNQNFNPSLADINIIMDAVTEMIRPFNGNNLTIVVTAIQQNDPDLTILPDVMWQVKRDTGTSNPSQIAPGGLGSKVKIPGLSLRQSDQVIVVELFNQYPPLINTQWTQSLATIMAGDITYKFHIGRPRVGAFQFAPQ